MKSNGMIVTIEFLRGVGAWMVLTCHYSIHFGCYSYIAEFMWIGVYLFFVISGYVFGDLIFYREERIKPYLIKRFFRIYPLYILSLLFYYIFSAKEEVAYNYLIKHILLLHTTKSVEEAMYFNPAYWSIPVEVEFYLFIPFLVFIRKTVGKLAIYLCLIISLFAKFIFSYFSDLSSFFEIMNVHIPSMLPEFGCGILLFKAMEEKDKVKNANAVSIVSFILGSIILISCGHYFFEFGNFGIQKNIIMKTYFSTFCSISFLLLLYGILNMNVKIFTKFMIDLFMWIGATSYGIYLFHNLMPKISSFLGITTKNINTYFIYILFLLLISSVFNLLIEKPFRSFGRSIAKKYI